MAHIAAIGAVGDGFFVDGQLVSQNREVALEAVQQGMIEIRKHETGEQYIVDELQKAKSLLLNSVTISISWEAWAITKKDRTWGSGFALKGFHRSRTGWWKN